MKKNSNNSISDSNKIQKKPLLSKIKNKITFRKAKSIAKHLSLISLVVAAPVLAESSSWADNINTQLNTIIDGLKLLGRGVATIVGLWGALMMLSGRRKFSDMWQWFVGAATFLAIAELVALFFGA